MSVPSTYKKIIKVYLVCDIAAAEVKINGLLRFLCVDLADSHHPTFFQEQGERVAIAHVTHPQCCANSCPHDVGTGNGNYKEREKPLLERSYSEWTGF